MDEQVREARFNAEMGRKIRAVRSKAGLVQGQLAQMTGLSRASITNIEAGSQAPPPYRLARIAEALKVDTADLVPNIREIGAPSLPPDFADALASVTSIAQEKERVQHGQS